MTKKNQEELFKAETTWFHIFRAMIDSGDVAKMGPHAVTVYLVIKAHTNFSTGRSFPSLDTIIEKSGISRAQVLRSFRVLEDNGYLSKEKKGRSNVYTLREKVEITDGNGRPQAVATWDYLPSTVKAAQAELRKFRVTGDTGGLQIIHIEHLTLNVQTHCDSPQQTNFNIGDIKDPELRQAILDAYDKSLKRKDNAQ